MNEQDDDQKLIQSICSQLDQSTDSLDYATQLKLKSARESALNQPKKKNFFWLSWGVPSFVTATFAIWMFSISFSINDATKIEPNWLQDIELLAAEEEFEFIEELEFYEWLETEEAVKVLES